jgi:RND family efflux transporter MFP subunit
MSKKSLKQVLVNASLPLLVLAAGVGAGSVVINSKAEPETAEAAPLLRSINATRAAPERLALTVQSQGTVQPRQQISLIPQVSGQIEWVSAAFVNGGQFRAGELLLRIDASDYELALKSAEAAVADAQQQLDTVRAQAEQAAADWNLLDKGEPSALALRKPQLAGAEARLLSTQAELERARLQLARTELRAPFNGVLSDKQVDFGQFVGAGTQIARLLSSDEMEVRLALPERELQHLPLEALGADGDGIPVTLQGMSGTATRWQARLVRSEGVLDPQTRNMTLVASISGPDLTAANGQPLLPGTFVTASITGRDIADVVRLPRTALHSARSVFLVDADGRLQERDVELLDVSDEWILVAGGIAAGELVSTSPLTGSAQGQQVTAIEAEGNSI